MPLSVVFSHLEPTGLASPCCVCKRWSVLINSLWGRLDLGSLFPTLTIIDGRTWSDYVHLEALGLKIDDPEVEAGYLSPTNKRTIVLALNKLFASPLIDNKAGITLLTLPQGLVIDTFKKIHESPHLLKKGNLLPPFGFFSNLISKAHINTPIEKTYTIAIANTILKGSTDLFFAEQENLIAELPGCERTGVLAAVALNMMSYIISSDEKSPTRLFGDNPRIEARCKEWQLFYDGDNEDERWHVNVGDFAPAPGGLVIGIDGCSSSSLGVVPMRKLF
jgi:hypothetical protein